MLIMKTYSIRLFPTAQQADSLFTLSSIRNDIWNTLIDLQSNEYDNNKKMLSLYELQKNITNLKQTTHREWGLFNSKAAQCVARDLFTAYQTFFYQIKHKKVASKPRKIATDKEVFHTLNFNQVGWYFRDGNININKIPIIFKAKNDIDVLAKLNIKEIRVKNKNGKWLCDFVINNHIIYGQVLTRKNNILAIDLGLEKLGTGIDTQGNMVILPNNSKKINQYFQSQIKNTQSKLSKKQKQSRKHKKLKVVLNKLYQRKNAQIKQALHIQSKQLTNMNYKTIVVGDLNVKNLMAIEGINSNKKNVRKSFSQSNISMFLNFLSYKCSDKNIDLVKIDERWTTQLNSYTGKLFTKKVELHDRTVMLCDGVVIDRDLNSAINIYNRWHSNHLAAATPPLDLSSVINKYNLVNTTDNTVFRIT